MAMTARGPWYPRGESSADRATANKLTPGAGAGKRAEAKAELQTAYTAGNVQEKSAIAIYAANAGIALTL